MQMGHVHMNFFFFFFFDKITYAFFEDPLKKNKITPRLWYYAEKVGRA